MDELSWMDEKVEKLPKYNWIYKISCFFVGRPRKKMTYKEIYMIIKKLNEKNMTEEICKKYAFSQILAIYKFLHGKIPEGVIEKL